MGKLSFEQGKFYFEASAHAGSEALAASRAKLQKDAETLRWVTRNPRKAVKLRQWADKSAEQKFKKYFITDFPLPEQIIYPDHLSPKFSQIESAWHCVTRTPSYCADEAGLGKTIVAMLCINTKPGKTLIICPPFLKYNWAAEIEKWEYSNNATLAIIEGGKAASNDTLWNEDIVIVPDSLILNPLVQRMIAEREWEWLFVDEAHRYKEATTQRTKALIGDEKDGKSGITQSANRCCYLSGTPIPNGRPIELYSLLSGTAPESILWRDAVTYGETFCDGKRVTRHEGAKAIVQWDFSGSSNLKKLRRELRAKLMIRHLKKDVLKELGPKTRKIVFLDDVDKLRALEKRVLANHSLEDLMGEDHELGDIATYRREVGVSKITPAFLYINELLEESPEKLVVFAHHIEVVETLTKLLSLHNPLMIRGGMTPKQKAERVRLFQTGEANRVIIGNMDAMGVGNTLTRAPGVVIVEPSWVPGINEQAEDRVHRMTQKQNVYVRYLVLRNSLDERMLTQVLDKQNAITQLMD